LEGAVKKIKERPMYVSWFIGCRQKSKVTSGKSTNKWNLNDKGLSLPAAKSRIINREEGKAKILEGKGVK